MGSSTSCKKGEPRAHTHKCAGVRAHVRMHIVCLLDCRVVSLVDARSVVVWDTLQPAHFLFSLSLSLSPLLSRAHILSLLGCRMRRVSSNSTTFEPSQVASLITQCTLHHLIHPEDVQVCMRAHAYASRPVL